MSPLDELRLAWRNVAGNRFRSGAVLGCAAALAGLALATALLLSGAQRSLQLARARLGADIIAVPAGAQPGVEGALLMGVPTQAWMPRANLARIAAIPGVAAVSPQMYLASLSRASCCAVSEMLLVAYDPESDFAVAPWLARSLGRGLVLGEAVGGSSVFVPEGEEAIRLYGYDVRLRGNLEPTGTNLDRSLFFTFETAAEMARLSHGQAERPLEIPPDSISAALVKVAPGSDARLVALTILQEVPGVTPLEGADMLRSFRGQIAGLLRTLLALLGLTLGASLLLLALVFSLAAHERRREIALLRALGASAGAVCRMLLAEAGLRQGAPRWGAHWPRCASLCSGA
ncbi:MAG TPA: hypothetical protein PLJ35_01160 [Anaerolineae bacterium]|nr:hypothetical protein [Anaerolineae bacterium]HOQ97413.1 hypothetical protein [Anaerolineae bacterium]HPL27908.1 hypothetical protein [Anaerolineae bacterium]